MECRVGRVAAHVILESRMIPRYLTVCVHVSCSAILMVFRVGFLLIVNVIACVFVGFIFNFQSVK